MTSLDEYALAHETPIRLGWFLLVFALVGALEALRPRRSRELTRLSRWPHNLTLVALNVVVLRVLFPFAAIAMAVYAERRGLGLFRELGASYVVAFVGSVVALDLVIYLQHVMTHAIPLLWRLHQVHHADLDYDVTTGARFHPIEMVLSMCIKLATVALLGAPVAAVLAFEVLLNVTAMFNHGNLYLPPALDRVLRLVVVTPDMHRVHHSVTRNETNSNFGFNLPWWDRLFGTYEAQPAAGHEGMTIGLKRERDPARCDTLWGMLAMPFVGQSRGYALNDSRD